LGVEGYLQKFFADNPQTALTVIIAVGGHLQKKISNTPQRVYGWFGDFFEKK